MKPQEDGDESIFCQMQQPFKFNQKLTHNQTQRLFEVHVKQAFKPTAALRRQPLTTINIADWKESHWIIRSFFWASCGELQLKSVCLLTVNGLIFSNVISADPCLRLFFVFTSSSVLRFHFRPDWCLIAVDYSCACLHLEHYKTTQNGQTGSSKIGQRPIRRKTKQCRSC